MSRTASKSLVGLAHDKLKEEIRSNRMPSGFQATEPEMAQRLGMSRTPVREALIRLEAEGLVELVPRHGARVLPMNADDMREIYDILGSLEPDAAARVAERRLSPRALSPLERAASEMEEALAREDLEGWARADDAFHLSLLEIDGNRRLQGFVGSLYDQAHRARMVTLRLRELPEASTREHREILDHLKGGEAEKARAAFRAHRKRAATELLSLIETLQLAHL